MTSKEAIDRYLEKKTLIRKELINELYNILAGIGMDGIIKRNWDGRLGKIKVADYASSKTPEYRFYTFKEPGVLNKLQSGRIPSVNAEEYIMKNFSQCDQPELNFAQEARDTLMTVMGKSKEYKHVLDYTLKCINEIEKQKQDGENE